MLLKPQGISDIHRNSVPKNHRNSIWVEAGSGGMNNLPIIVGAAKLNITRLGWRQKRVVFRIQWREALHQVNNFLI